MNKKIKIGKWSFSPDTHRLEAADKSMMLENRQAQLLLFLARNSGRDISKQELFDHLWRPHVVNDDALYVCIGNLRKALGDNPRSPVYIKTLPGYGYRLLAPVTETQTALKPSRFRTRHRQPLYFLAASATAAGLLGAALLLPTQEPVAVEPPALIADDYRRARFLFSQGNEQHGTAMALVQKTMAAAPEFAGSYALAAYHEGQNVFGDTISDARLATLNSWIRHALTLEPNHQQAHLAKANLLFGMDWDFEQARHHYEKALGGAESYFHYAQFLLAMGDFERALAASYRYQDLDPEGYSVASVAWIETMAGRYDDALESINALNILDPNNFYYHVSRQAIFEQLGERGEAYVELRWLMQEAGYTAKDMELVQLQFEAGGLKNVYAWLLDTDEKQFNIGQYEPPLSLARYAIAAGQYQQALEFLEQAVNQRQVEVLWLAVDPKYKPLHKHPLFTTLLHKIGLNLN